MTGILLTDFYMMRKQLALGAGIAVVYLVIGIANHSAWSLVTFLMIFAAILPINIFYYNDQCQWDLYVNTLPVRRKDYVNAKFAFVFLLVLAALIFGLVGISLDNLIHSAPLLENVDYALITSTGGLVYASVFLALIMKMGSERARIFMIALIFIPAIAVLTLPKMGIDLGHLLEIADPHIFIPLGAAAAFAVILIAYLFCLKFYKQKEL